MAQISDPIIYVGPQLKKRRAGRACIPCHERKVRIPDIARRRFGLAGLRSNAIYSPSPGTERIAALVVNPQAVYAGGQFRSRTSRGSTETISGLVRLTVDDGG